MVDVRINFGSAVGQSLNHIAYALYVHGMGGVYVACWDPEPFGGRFERW